MIAARNHSIAFIVMMAGIRRQRRRRAGGAERPHFRSDGRDARGRRWPGPVEIRALHGVVRQPTGSGCTIAKPRCAQLLAGQAPEPQITAQIQGAEHAVFRYFLGYDPAPALKQVTCPVLAINGERDLQVPPKQSLPAIRAAFAASGNTKNGSHRAAGPQPPVSDGKDRLAGGGTTQDRRDHRPDRARHDRALDRQTIRSAEYSAPADDRAVHLDVHDLVGIDVVRILLEDDEVGEFAGA